MISKWKVPVGALLVVAFLVTVVFPAAAYARDPVKITSATVKGLVRNDNIKQDAGFIKVTEIEKCDVVYVQVELPEGVRWSSKPGKDDYEHNGQTSRVVSSDQNTMEFWVSGSDTLFSRNGYIKVLFRNLIISRKADSEINVRVKVRGVEDGLQVYEYSTACKTSDVGAGVTVTAKSPPAVSYGTGKLIAAITIAEKHPGAIHDGDKLVMRLPDGTKWKSGMSANHPYVTQGLYGLTVKDFSINTDNTERDELVVSFAGPSKTFADQVELNLAVDLTPDVQEGDLVLEVSAGEPFIPGFDSTRLTVAVMGNAEGDVTVADTSNDGIYPAHYGMRIDDITIKASGGFNDGDRVTLNLPRGFVWYDINAWDIPNGIKDVLSVYDSGRSLWIELDSDEDTVIFEDLEIASLPDAPLGDIQVSVTGSYTGLATVGKCVAAVSVSSTKRTVTVPGQNQAAGDIIIREAQKDSLDDGELILSLPAGVKFAAKPVFTINGNRVEAIRVFLSASGDRCVVNLDLFSTRVDEITVSEIRYDIDTRLAKTDIQVEVSGSAINFLDGAGAWTDAAKYENDPVVYVVNASSSSTSPKAKVFKVGDPGVAVVNGRILVQVNLLTETLDLTKRWDAAARTAYFSKGGVTVAFPMGENAVYVDGRRVPLDQGGMIINGVTYATLRGVQEAFGGELVWDGVTKTATFKFD